MLRSKTKFKNFAHKIKHEMLKRTNSDKSKWLNTHCLTEKLKNWNCKN